MFVPWLSQWRTLCLQIWLKAVLGSLWLIHFSIKQGRNGCFCFALRPRGWVGFWTDWAPHNQRDLKPTHTKLHFSNTSLLKSSNFSPGKFLISEIKHRVWRFRGKMQYWLAFVSKPDYSHCSSFREHTPFKLTHKSVPTDLLSPLINTH